MASAELVWQIVKDNSCFLQKRKVPGRSQMGKMGPHFTTEPNNLAGINSWKYSGLANTKSVGIDAAAGGGVFCRGVISGKVLGCRTFLLVRFLAPLRALIVIRRARDLVLQRCALAQL